MSDEKDTTETSADIESIEPETDAEMKFETIRATRILHSHQYGLIGIQQDRALTDLEQGGETIQHVVYITEGLFDELIAGLHKMNRHMENPDEEYGS